MSNAFDGMVDGPVIFDSVEPLTDDWEPGEIRERDDKIEEIASNLVFIFDHERPLNMTIYGDTGVGKTVVTNKVISDVKQKAEELNADSESDQHYRVTTVRVSCRDLTTEYKLARALENELAARRGEEGMSRGAGTNKVYESMFEHLDEIGGTVLIVLDEVHKVGAGLDGVLFPLSRANSANEGPPIDATVGIIMIAPTTGFKSHIESDTERTLDDEAIEFGPYDANQLTEILKPRVEKAFAESAIAQDGEHPVRLAAALAAQDAGNASQALDIMRTAGQIAKRNGHKQVTEGLVKQAKEKVEREYVARTLSKQPVPGKVGMAALLEFDKYDLTPVSTGKLHEVYEEYVRYAGDLDNTIRGGLSSISKNRLRQHLEQLDDDGLLVSRTEAPGAGRYRIWEFADNVEPDDVLEEVQKGDKLDWVGSGARWPVFESEEELPTRVRDW